MTTSKTSSETSIMAYKLIKPRAHSMRMRLMALIEAAGDHGVTDDEAEVSLGLLHQTLSARRRELVLLKKIKDSGGRRATRTGRTATVWVAQAS